MEITKTSPGKVIFDDYEQWYDRGSAYHNSFDSTLDAAGNTVRNNITHYYGAGLLIYEGGKEAAKAAVNALDLTAAENTYTLRYKNDDGSYGYLRNWNGTWYNSYVYRNDENLDLIKLINEEDKLDLNTLEDFKKVFDSLTNDNKAYREFLEHMQVKGISKKDGVNIDVEEMIFYYEHCTDIEKMMIKSLLQRIYISSRYM